MTFSTAITNATLLAQAHNWTVYVVARYSTTLFMLVNAPLSTDKAYARVDACGCVTTLSFYTSAACRAHA